MDSIASLADEVPVSSSTPHIKRKRFYLELSGTKTTQKETILNLALLVFVQNHKRKSPSPNATNDENGEFSLDFQPGTFTSHLRTLFGHFAREGVLYKMKDFEKDGGFLSWLYKRWNRDTKVRSDFGSLPLQAVFDSNMDNKIKEAIKEGKLDIRNNFRHLTMLIINLLGKSSMLRGASEVRNVSNFLSF